jgi:hypothetical protein
MFDKFGRVEGYGQMAPGRDLEELEEQKRNGRPPGSGADINQAILGGMPAGGTTPFAGAQQTIGAKPPAPPQEAPPMGPAAPLANTGISGYGQPGGVQAPPIQPPAGSSPNNVFGQTPAAHRAEGTAAGNDMSWMDQPGAVQTAPTPTPAPQRHAVRLMEGESGKLGNAEHAAKSPKYDFLNLAQSGEFNYDQLPQMLQKLQSGPNAALWNGWSANGDKFTFNGDPSQLHPTWNGVTSVDAIGGFKSGNPEGFRWGAEGPGGPAPQGGPSPSLGGMQSAILGTGTPGEAQGGDYSANLLKQIMQALQVNPELAQIAQKSGFR